MVGKIIMINEPIASFVPAQLWVGPHALLRSKLIHYFEKKFCIAGGCSTCRTCMAIQEQQHCDIFWLLPEKQYKTEQIDELLHKMSFKLEQNKSFYFVIQRADLLTPATANRLLKSIEEPPAGYYFFLLSEQKELILPTIQSRCCVYNFYDTVINQDHQELYGVFTDINRIMLPANFLGLMQRTVITDQETKTLFERIVSFWVEQLKKKSNDVTMDNTQAMRILEYLSKQSSQLPASGGSKLFWMNLFLGLRM